MTSVLSGAVARHALAGMETIEKAIGTTTAARAAGAVGRTLPADAPAAATQTAEQKTLADALGALRARVTDAGGDVVKLAAAMGDYAALALANDVGDRAALGGLAQATGTVTGTTAAVVGGATAATGAVGGLVATTTAGTSAPVAPAAATAGKAAILARIATLDAALAAETGKAPDALAGALGKIRDGVVAKLADREGATARLDALEAHYEVTESLAEVSRGQQRNVLYLFGLGATFPDGASSFAPLPADPTDLPSTPAGGRPTPGGAPSGDPVAADPPLAAAPAPAVSQPAAPVPSAAPVATTPQAEAPVPVATAPLPAAPLPTAPAPIPTPEPIPVAATPVATVPAPTPVAAPAPAPTTVVTAPAPAVDTKDSAVVGTIDYSANKATERLVWLPTSTVTGGSGDDKIRFALLGAATTVNLGDGRNTVDARSAGGIRTIVGGAGVDEILLGAMNNTESVDLGAGDDVLVAQGKVGTVRGGAGNDTIVLKAGGSGYGGDGNDTFVGSGVAATFNGDAGDDTLVVDLATLSGTQRTTFDGGAGTDTVRINLDGASAARVAALFAELYGAAGALTKLDAANLDLKGVEKVEVKKDGTLTTFTF